MSSDQINRAILFIFIMGMLISCARKLEGSVVEPTFNVYTAADLAKTKTNFPKSQNAFTTHLSGVPSNDDIREFLGHSYASRMLIYDQKNQLIGPDGAIDYFFSSFEYPPYFDLSTDFRRCDSDFMTEYRFPYGDMDYLISKIEVSDPQMLEAYTYKVFTFWNSDLPNQSENLDRSWIKMVGNFKPNESVLFINILTDLQEDWGLRPDGKVFYILTKMEGSDDLYVGKLSELPYK